MLNVIILSVVILSGMAPAFKSKLLIILGSCCLKNLGQNTSTYSECNNAKCYYIECRYAKCRDARFLT
jgi:hypothetical protein